MRSTRMFAVTMALAILASGCMGTQKEGGDHDRGHETSLKIGDVPERVEGNVVTLPIAVGGVEVVKADGDTSGDTGHLHAFIDKEPVEAGEVIPREAGIVHSADTPLKLYGLRPGEHEITVVLGDGTHQRIGDVEDSVKVEVEGPSVHAAVPADAEEGDDVVVKLDAEGVDIVPADSKRTKETGHFHVLVDPKVAPEAGQAIPPAVENKIIHTAESPARISGLEKGEHTIWLVLGDGQHYAFDPPAMDKVTVVVE